MCIAAIEHFGIELLLSLVVQNHLCIAAVAILVICCAITSMLICWLAFFSARDLEAWLVAMRIMEHALCAAGLAGVFAACSVVFGKWDEKKGRRVFVSLGPQPGFYRPPHGPPRVVDSQPQGPEEADA